MTTPHIDTIRPRPGTNLKFDEFVVFNKFLTAVLSRYSSELSKMSSPNDIKSLSGRDDLRQFQTLLTDTNFAGRWNNLYAKCSTDARPFGKSMKTEANVIKHALSTRPDLLTAFNDFPVPPRHDYGDMKKYSDALKTLMMQNCDFYSDSQRNFIDICILIAGNNRSLFNLQSKLKTVNKGHTNCLDLKWRSLSPLMHSVNENDHLIPQSELTEVYEYVQMAYFDRCKCQEETLDKDETTSTAEHSVDEVTSIAEHSVATVSTSPIPTNLSICSMEPQTVGQTLPAGYSLRSSGVKRSADTIHNAVPEPKKKRESSTGTNHPLKFDTFSRFRDFLEVLLNKFGDELSKFKTPDEIKKLADHPAMKPYQNILLNEHFSRRWRLLYEKCDTFVLSSKKSMKLAAQEMSLELDSKGSLLRQFADFPVKISDSIEDVKLYFDQLSTMRYQETTSYNKAQKAYISGRLSDAKKLLRQLQKDGWSRETHDSSIDLSDVLQSNHVTTEAEVPCGEPNSSNPQSVEEHLEPPAEANIEPQPLADDTSLSEMRSIDYFIAASGLPKEEAYEKFSYLSATEREMYYNLEKAFKNKERSK